MDYCSEIDDVEDELSKPENFEFPFIPYDIQQNFMQNLYWVIETRKLGIFESPTGTGKSLSIICGAIKWLKDHNELVRSNLARKISNLEAEKAGLSCDTDDWISSQFSEIKIQHKLDSVKLANAKVVEFDKRMENLKSLKKIDKKLKRKNWNCNKQELAVDDLEKNEEKNIDEEDILLEELNVSNEDDSLEEKEEEMLYQPIKIFICSRTHSQLTQFIGEIIKSPFASKVRVALLASRQNYCINPEVTKMKNMTLINERCLDMQKKKGNEVKGPEGKVLKRQKSVNCRCPYYKQEAIEDLKNYALVEVQDIEDLVNSGKELNACPYYASRKAAEDAEVVLIPYNTLLHKATREANGILLKNSVVIIDEAHNLLEALAQMYSSDLTYVQIENALQQLTSYKERYRTRFSASNLLSINKLTFVVNKLKKLFENSSSKDKNSTKILTVENFVLTAQIDNFNMFALVQFCKDTRIAQKIRGFAIKHPLDEQKLENIPQKGIKDFLTSIENKKKPIKKSEVKVAEPNVPKKNLQPPSNNILAVISFLETLTYSYEDGRILMIENVDKSECKLKFLLLNPSSNFTDIVNEARSVIVAGGTMKPISEFRDRLFLSAGANEGRIVEFSCDHIIPPENILPIIMTKGAKNESLLFNFENRMAMGNNIKSIILECCKKVKGGIVVFFPSYNYENWFWQQGKDLNFGRMVFREPKNSGSVDSILEKYAEAIKKPSSPGALLLSVVGGKLSEGLNFSDDLGRCVIVVGMPYANIMAADLKEKMCYLDKTEGSGSGQKFYEGLCMKAVNQCIGRAVRHRNDYATVLLLDERYNKITTKNSLPGWIKRSLQVCNFEETFQLFDKFFKNRTNEKN